MSEDFKVTSALNWLREAVQSKDLRDGGKMHRLAVKVIEEEIDALRRELADEKAERHALKALLDSGKVLESQA